MLVVLDVLEYIREGEKMKAYFIYCIICKKNTSHNNTKENLYCCEECEGKVKE